MSKQTKKTKQAPPVDWQDLGNQAAAAIPKDEQLKSLSKMVEHLNDVERQVASLELSLENLNETKRNLAENLIPSLMTELGMATFTLTDGSSVEVKKYYSARIDETLRPAAHAWLRKNGLDDIIKNEVVVSFGKGKDKDASKLVEDLVNMGLEVAHKEGVHPQTLKSFVKERIETAKELPLDLFGVHIGDRAKVTQPKVTTKKVS